MIEEFRANQGRIGGRFDGRPMVLVHHKGRRTGIERVNPLTYQKVDDGWAVFASFAGAPTHPDWYRNLMHEPRTTIEIGEDTIEVLARELTGAQRDEVYDRQTKIDPIFGEYQVKAGARTIPVVVFQPI